MTALILVGLAAGYYFGWPYVGSYWSNTALKGILRSNARDCGQGRTEECLTAIKSKALGELGIDLSAQDLVVSVATTNKVVFKISYRSKLEYPFTGTMFGSGKDRFHRYTFSLETKLSGY
ncbi:MAG: hypothetical protein ABIJ09_20335 [Pseudomonadota bacterium]